MSREKVKTLHLVLCRPCQPWVVRPLKPDGVVASGWLEGIWPNARHGANGSGTLGLTESVGQRFLRPHEYLCLPIRELNPFSLILAVLPGKVSHLEPNWGKDRAVPEPANLCSSTPLYLSKVHSGDDRVLDSSSCVHVYFRDCRDIVLHAHCLTFMEHRASPRYCVLRFSTHGRVVWVLTGLDIS